ncbi:hypothetical protein M407DRAFT_193392 [Tulasnella calospora MUT 4182]|uniref:Uncharacterized protein n=1 Tax=Tulasnella calospora MUT 4182 TaxID=1051891 RepID=A0A0C3QAE9_9AGAM|nr:hypothetical protein M407DRAFT_193392 [Tulasnella calospora MUT 4182]
MTHGYRRVWFLAPPIRIFILVVAFDPNVPYSYLYMLEGPVSYKSHLRGRHFVGNFGIRGICNGEGHFRPIIIPCDRHAHR